MMKFIDKNNKVGDFARDMAIDSESKNIGNTLNEWEEHLSEHNADESAKDLLKISWKSYEYYTNPQTTQTQGEQNDGTQEGKEGGCNKED